MPEAPKVPRRRRPAEPQAVKTPDSPVTLEATPAPKTTQCLFAGMRGVIDWLNVVDDFKLNGHRNYLPRWGFVMVVLLYFAVF